MYAILLLIFAIPVHAGVSAKMGIETATPRIFPQTSMSPATVLGVAPIAAFQGSLSALAAPQMIVPAATIPAPPAAHAALAPAAEDNKAALSATIFDGRAPLPESTPRVGPIGLVSRIKSGLKKLSSAASPPLLRSLYDDNSREHYYHGLSLGTLEKVIDSGGSLAAEATFVSDEAGHPYGYARKSARRTGTAGVVLQFKKDSLDTLIVPGHYNPRAPGPGEKWVDVPHWFQAIHDIPLTEQTDLSKKTVLAWLTHQRDAHPADPSWSAKLSKFAASFGAAPRTPASKTDKELE